MKPKLTKFNKYFRPKIKNKHKISKVLYTAGIICMEPSFITDIQLQSTILTLKRVLKRRGKIILRVFPHQSITKKPIQTRMGKGKGSIYKWLQPIKAGSIILEINLKSNASEILAINALKSIETKLPFKCKVIAYK